MSNNIDTLRKIWLCLIDQYEDEQLLYASKTWRKGYKQLDLQELPYLEDLQVPGWSVMAMSPGPKNNFYRRMKAMSQGVVLVPTHLRPLEKVTSSEEEDDMYTIVAGLLPMLHNPAYTWAIRTFAALYTGSPARLWPKLGKLYKDVFEDGLRRDHHSEEGEFVGPFGYRILTNFQELHRTMAAEPKTHPFDSFTELRHFIIDEYNKIIY